MKRVPRASVVVLLVLLVACEQREQRISSDRTAATTGAEAVGSSAATSSTLVPTRLLVVTLDRAKLAAYGLTVNDVEEALRGRGLAVLSQRDVDHDGMSATVLRCNAADVELGEIGRLALRVVNGAPVRLSDVATLEIGPGK